jgi:hypothetical protein
MENAQETIAILAQNIDNAIKEEKLLMQETISSFANNDYEKIIKEMINKLKSGIDTKTVAEYGDRMLKQAKRNDGTVDIFLEQYINPIRNEIYKNQKLLEKELKTTGGNIKGESFIMVAVQDHSYNIEAIEELINTDFADGGLKDFVDDKIFKKSVSKTQIDKYIKEKYGNDMNIYKEIMDRINKTKIEKVDYKVKFERT